MEIDFAPAGVQAKINSKINCKITGGSPC